jgi:hypothetical protein
VQQYDRRTGEARIFQQPAQQRRIGAEQIEVAVAVAGVDLQRQPVLAGEVERPSHASRR